jgi:hypothetical protein
MATAAARALLVVDRETVDEPVPYILQCANGSGAVSVRIVLLAIAGLLGAGVFAARTSLAAAAQEQYRSEPRVGGETRRPRPTGAGRGRQCPRERSGLARRRRGRCGRWRPPSHRRPCAVADSVAREACSVTASVACTTAVITAG